jgi:acetyl-CoA carboxylase biotin carboxylase subunit
VALAKAANYVNAGTVEFLLDSNRNFYFMEMNTRLQVEHPVTEMVYGVDLVRWQIKIAAGEPLAIQQEQVRPRGWSFEARINAEDPLRGFVPALGRLNRYIPPAGHGVRMDSCAYEGYTIPSQYDSMVAKLIVTASSRDAAIGKMLRALDEFIVTGTKTTIPFHRFVFSHAVFRSGSFDTGFVESYFSDEQVRELMHSRVSLAEDQSIAVAAGLQYYLERTSLISSNARDDDKAGQRWSVVNRLASTSFIPG